MTKNLIALIVGLSACGGGSASSTGSTMPTGTDAEGVNVSLQNVSSYDIHSIQVTPYDQETWGENLLGSDPLLHGETGVIVGLGCSKYDLRMVDDENVECVVQDIDLCFEDHNWKIDDAVLASCATGWAD